jgi:hypothetical protein
MATSPARFGTHRCRWRPATRPAAPPSSPAVAGPWPARPAPPPRRPARPRWRRGKDGFYVWKKLNGRKQPYYIRLQDGRPFAFAGLWEHWNRGDSPIDEWHVDLEKTVTLEKLGSYPPCPDSRKERDLRNIHPIDSCTILTTDLAHGPALDGSRAVAARVKCEPPGTMGAVRLPLRRLP